MNQSIVEILEITGWAGGFLFICFRFLDAQQTNSEKEITKISYTNIWQKIDQANIQSLPKKVIQYLLKVFDKRYTILKDIVTSQKIKKLAHNWVLFIVILFIAQTGYINNEENVGIFAWIDMVFTLLMGTQLGLFFLYRTKWGEDILRAPKANYLIFFAASYYLSFFITTTVLIIDNVSIFENRISASVFLTNLIFDSLTILTTFYIFDYCLKFNKSLIYILGIIVDVAIAAIFAFLSLYLVTLISDLNLTSEEIFNILMFKSKEGINWRIDKWFWVVHSTFVPTLFYMGIIIVSIIGKAIILPISRIFKKAGLVDKPHYLTANLFAFIGACSYGLAKILT